MMYHNIYTTYIYVHCTLYIYTVYIPYEYMYTAVDPWIPVL